MGKPNWSMCVPPSELAQWRAAAAAAGCSVSAWLRHAAQAALRAAAVDSPPPAAHAASGPSHSHLASSVPPPPTAPGCGPTGVHHSTDAPLTHAAPASHAAPPAPHRPSGARVPSDPAVAADDEDIEALLRELGE